MAIAAGLVGLPNVGKSTLFNALTRSSVPAENYPFCTIDPHLAITTVRDARLEKLQAIYQSKRIVPATVQFVDIAGLVKGAASGEGLGNQFLAHIRDVHLIIHVLRCFEDPDIILSRTDIDPIGDYEIIVTELMLKDLESVNKRREKVMQLLKAAQKNPVQFKELSAEQELLIKLEAALNVSDLVTVKKLLQETPLSSISLLSAKPSLIVANIGENDISDDAYLNSPHYQKVVAHFGSEHVVPICAKLEGELARLSDDAESAELAAMMGLKKSGLTELILKTYTHLGLITFFTCGPQEIHAWPIRARTVIRAAAGEIHSDLERGFICADVFNIGDLIPEGSAPLTETKVRDLGKMRTEGHDYMVRDGDIVHIKFNVS